MTESPSPGWDESDLRHFIEVGRVLIPRRDEIERTLLDLLPAAAHDSFLALELCPGAGWLSRALLARFPQARVLGLDGSETMLVEAQRTLEPYSGRFELRHFRLEEDDWRRDLPHDIRCVLSSLAIHHLDGAGKRRLYVDMYEHLDEGGALLIADLLLPASEWERRYMAWMWDDAVKRQSLELVGDLSMYERFKTGEWNYFEYPDPFDKPSKLVDNLAWLREAGFRGVDAFWMYAGHVVYGGYKE